MIFYFGLKGGEREEVDFAFYFTGFSENN